MLSPLRGIYGFAAPDASRTAGQRGTLMYPHRRLARPLRSASVAVRRSRRSLLCLPLGRLHVLAVCSSLLTGPSYVSANVTAVRLPAIAPSVHAKRRTAPATRSRPNLFHHRPQRPSRKLDARTPT